MNKLLAIPLLLAMILLPACGASGPVCLDVLEDGAAFRDIASGSEMTLDEYAAEYGVTVARYAALDLDGDGAEELALWLTLAANEYYGFLILHAGQDAVHGHMLNYRQFTDLKADGTFSYSAGVADHGVARLAFADGAYDAYTLSRLAWSESDGAQNVSRYIASEAVTQADFDEYIAAQAAKPDAAWQALTPAPSA